MAAAQDESLQRTAAALTVMGAEQALTRERTDERFTELIGRSDRLDQIVQLHEDRLAAADAARSQLKTSLDQTAADLLATQARLADLVARTDTLRAELAASVATSAAIMARTNESARAIDQLTEHGAAMSTSLRDLQALAAEDRDRFEQIFARLEPLGPALAAVDRLDATTAELGDRLTAAELLLNQRDDFELQLERAEEFERLISEIDPDRYASREEIDELRRLIDEMGRLDHAP
jgi:chromosome segregation ATPase